MTALFSYLFETLIASFILVMALLAIRALFPKLPRKYLCFLWALVLVRVLIPLRFSANSDSIPVLSFSFENGGVESVSIESSLPLLKTLAEDTAALFSAPLSLSSEFLSALFAAWVTGTAFLILYWFFGCLKILKIKRNSYKAASDIYCSEEIKTPFTFGIFHPFIIVPKDASPEDFDLVITHERTHIRRKDSLWKSICFFVLALFWFNPFMWIAFLAFSRDIEMACDEAVSEKLPDKRAKYAAALLRFSSRSDIRISSFGGKAVKRRIHHMLAYKQLSIQDSLRFIPVLVLFLAVFFSTPKVVSAAAEKRHEIHSLEDRILTESPVLFVKTDKDCSETVMGSSSWRFAKDKENWDGIERDISLDQVRMLLEQMPSLEGNDFSLFCDEAPGEIRVGFMTRQDYLHSDYFDMKWGNISSLSFSVPSEAYLVVIYAGWTGDYCDGACYYYFLRS